MSHEESIQLLVLKQGVILPGGDSDASYGGFLMAGGRFLDHPVYRWIFPYKSSIFGYHHLLNTPHMIRIFLMGNREPPRRISDGPR